MYQGIIDNIRSRSYVQWPKYVLKKDFLLTITRCRLLQFLRCSNATRSDTQKTMTCSMFIRQFVYKTKYKFKCQNNNKEN